jgi:3-oxoacyl-[acyl-carrier protein] reductase
MEFEGKVAIVTGASMGIGAAYCLALAGAGATVVAAARTIGTLADGGASHNSLAEVAQAGRGLPGQIYVQACDVAHEADVARVVDQTIATFGRVDVLVNNAAIYPPNKTFSVAADTWDKSMHVNVRGAYLMIRDVAPHMMRQRSGSIINLTSNSGTFTPKGHAGHEHLILYCVSKAALNRLSTYMSEELRSFGIAVNALSPGGVNTENWAAADPRAVAKWTAAGLVKPCTPEAIGPPMLFLARQTAESLTGQIVHADEFGKSWGMRR